VDALKKFIEALRQNVFVQDLERKVGCNERPAYRIGVARELMRVVHA
jgi:hypothetical protein